MNGENERREFRLCQTEKIEDEDGDDDEDEWNWKFRQPDSNFPLSKTALLDETQPFLKARAVQRQN
jgi:hypothetical protein